MKFLAENAEVTHGTFNETARYCKETKGWKEKERLLLLRVIFRYSPLVTPSASHPYIIPP
jgi:hypothetical protein